MDLRLLIPIAPLLALAGIAFGGPPVATVTSAGTFDLHGAAIKTEGIPYWPVMAGDEIGTHLSMALIRFPDGASVALGGNSRARVETVNGVLVFRLSSGTMQVIGGQHSMVRFYDGSQPVSVSSGVTQRVGRVFQPMGLGSLPGPPAPASGR